MKLVWSQEIASKAYISTVKMCKIFQESSEAEMISAMAGGWNPKLMVEVWSSGDTTTTSIGLAVAAHHSGARHMCMVQNERSRLEYMAAMRDGGLPPSWVAEVVVGEVVEVAAGLPEIEFMVVDGRRKDLCKVLRVAKISHRGAVILCKNATQRYMAGFEWDQVYGKETRVVRSVVIPVGQGLNIAYVTKNCESVKFLSKDQGRWITRIDEESGEEHIFRG